MLDIKRIASECIAEDWEPHGYYRNMDLAMFANAILEAAAAKCAAAVLEQNGQYALGYDSACLADAAMIRQMKAA